MSPLKMELRNDMARDIYYMLFEDGLKRDKISYIASDALLEDAFDLANKFVKRTGVD